MSQSMITALSRGASALLFTHSPLYFLDTHFLVPQFLRAFVYLIYLHLYKYLVINVYYLNNFFGGFWTRHYLQHRLAQYFLSQIAE